MNRFQLRMTRAGAYPAPGIDIEGIAASHVLAAGTYWRGKT